jgi:hypothetical protein
MVGIVKIGKMFRTVDSDGPTRKPNPPRDSWVLEHDSQFYFTGDPSPSDPDRRPFLHFPFPAGNPPIGKSRPSKRGGIGTDTGEREDAEEP